jgi:hypothetical protein
MALSYPVNAEELQHARSELATVYSGIFGDDLTVLPPRSVCRNDEPFGGHPKRPA